MNKLFSIIAVTLLVTASCFHSQASAGILLGSFENTQFGGQDDPIEAVISAIKAWQVESGVPVVDYSGLERLYKNNFNEDTGVGVDEVGAGRFETTYSPINIDGDAVGGTITQEIDPIMIDGEKFTPLFYTAKINGPNNAGFNLYAWDATNTFDWGFYKNDQNGLNYTYTTSGGEVRVNSWAVPTDPLVGTLATHGVSHVSVFGAFVDDNGGGGTDFNGVPEPASLAIFGALLGIAGFRCRRNVVAKK